MKISGTITCLEEFDKLIDKIRMRRFFTQQKGLPYRQECYRGQSVVDWSIIPSISRDLKTPTQVKEAEEKIMTHVLNEIATKNIQNLFYTDPNGQGYENEWALLRQAQHYFIPTRLIDWSIKPEVSLYFAVEDKKYQDVDGQFLVLFYPNILSDKTYITTHYSNIKETAFMNPVFGDRTAEMVGERRRARQHGKFLIQEYDKTLVGLDQQPMANTPWVGSWNELCMEKYIIPAQFKAQLKLDLIAKGWFDDEIYFQFDPSIKQLELECKNIISIIAKSL